MRLFVGKWIVWVAIPAPKATWVLKFYDILLLGGSGGKRGVGRE
jgi:hypothetical protein